MPVDISSAADLQTRRLRLAAVRETDAEEMAVVLSDPRLHEFIGGGPLGVFELRAQYRRWLAGSGNPAEIWLNWVVRLRETSEAVGTVQATVTLADPAGSAGAGGSAVTTGPARAAEVAWVIGTPWQGRGYAAEAAGALVAWLTSAGVGDVTACIHPRHRASEGVAERAGFALTTGMVDGERVWRFQRDAS
jgi:RimJ/RimL family protein N-acetyltransferase